MKRKISAIARGEDGKLKIVHDGTEIDCDKNHIGIDSLHRSIIAQGVIMVMIIADDDSVLRHWVAPAQGSPAYEAIISDVSLPNNKNSSAGI